MTKIFIDDQAVEASDGLTVLRAAEGAGIEIPHFCYHPAFAPEGSCRMCLVEIEGLPKLELACSTVIKDGMKVRTRSPKVVEARKNVLEFLLAEHPLDCPICDKAGECTLQNYYDEYGFFNGRFREAKEKREKKVRIGKNLLLDRERCILCTRCVRFVGEVTKTEDLGVLRRGVRAEISSYNSELVENNYSGNLVDICPVGAITDTDFRFKSRVWFLERKESICPFCSRGCNVYVDSHPGFPRVTMKQRVYRLRPRQNEAVNQHWICDFGRYSYPYFDEARHHEILMKKEGRDMGLSWDKALILMAEKVRSLINLKKASRMAVVLHTWLTNEELFLADRIFRKELHLENVYVADPLPGKGDGFLLTDERTPNRRGLQELGLTASAPDLKTLGEKTDLLLIFGSFLADLSDSAEVKSALDRIGTKVLMTSHSSRLDSLVDVIVPTLVIAEKSGSLTNVQGKVQTFSPALEFRGDGQPEWKILLDLARELKVNYKYFWQLTSPEAVRLQMGKEVPFFKK
jgi:NADH-quinone oxidoreductase subunit G